MSTDKHCVKLHNRGKILSTMKYIIMKMIMKNDCFLETPEERIKLLRAGFASKRIEELYVKRNNFEMVHAPILYENVRFDMRQDEKCSLSHDVTVEITRFLCKISKKVKLGLIPGLGLSFVLLASISTIFLALILWLLFIPPMVVLASIVFEGVSVISKELRKQPVSEKIALSSWGTTISCRQ